MERTFLMLYKRIVNISEDMAFVNKSCQKTTKFADQQPNFNSNWVEVQGHKVKNYAHCYGVKGIVRRNNHVKYESPISHGHDQGLSN